MRTPLICILAGSLLTSCLNPDQLLKRVVSREPIPTELRLLAGDVNQLERYVYAHGFGVAPRGTPLDDRHGAMLARRAADANAEANLIERLRGLSVRPDLLLRQLIERNNLQGVEERLAERSEIMSTTREADGIQVSLARINLRDYLAELKRSSGKRGALNCRYDPVSYLNYTRAENHRSWDSLRAAVLKMTGDRPRAGVGSTPRWRVPGTGQRTTPAKQATRGDWPGWVGVPWFLGPFQPPSSKKKQPDNPPPRQDAPVNQGVGDAMQFKSWPVKGLRWRKAPHVLQATRFLVPARPDKSGPDKTSTPTDTQRRLTPLGTRAERLMRAIVELPAPLSKGQVLVETLPKGSFPTGSIWVNVPASKSARATLVGNQLNVSAEGTTCVVYELRGRELTSEKLTGQVTSNTGRPLYQIAFASGTPPPPPTLDRASPRFLISSPSNNQLVGRAVESLVVSGTIADRSGIRDFQAGGTLGSLSRPTGKPEFPSKSLPRVVPFQLILPLSVGRNEMFLVSEDGQGNLGALRIIVFRQ